jgi:hypothetical protein
LDEQHLTNAYETFYQTSRHFNKQEYLAFTQGIRTIDTSVGLVSIIEFYFLIKEKFNDFIKNCPKTAFVIKLIDTNSFLLKLELIFRVLKANISKIECDELDDDEKVSRKRKYQHDEPFEVLETNTSTPETITSQAKRRKVSLATPVLKLNTNSHVKSNTAVDEDEKEKDTAENQLSLNSKRELNYISSPETSNKEDDVTEDESDDKNPLPKITPPRPEVRLIIDE